MGYEHLGDRDFVWILVLMVWKQGGVSRYLNLRQGKGTVEVECLLIEQSVDALDLKEGKTDVITQDHEPLVWAYHNSLNKAPIFKGNFASLGIF